MRAWPSPELGVRLPLLFVLLLAGCSTATEQHARIFVFGTLVDVQVYAANKQTVDDATRAVEKRFREMHQDWHAWKPGLLTRLNQAISEGKGLAVDARTAQLLRDAKSLSIRSDQLFNPAIGNLISLWGFHTDDYPIMAAPPKPQEIDTLLAAEPSMQNVNIDADNRVTSTNIAVKFDFGGFAKGAAVDEAMAIFTQYGLDNVVVNAGGDLRARGRHGNRAWRIAVRDPFSDLPLGIIEISGDESIFTSGNYERYLEHQGQRFAHILDPRNGRPVTAVVSATVIADTGKLADAAATALVVAGRDEWLGIAKSLGLTQVMLLTKEDTIFITQRMLERIEFGDSKKRKIEVFELPN